jgi:hypothetical protein
VTWLLSNVLLRGRAQVPAFWVACIAAALYEPLPLVLEGLREKGGLYAFAVIYRTATGPLFLGNVLAGYLFRRGGFLAPLTMRLAMYLVWHIAWGGWLVCRPL